MKPILYSFWRSSAAFRVRIALNLKGIDYDIIPVHLRKGGGEQLKEPYQALNPNGLVPLYIENGVPLHQSAAIIEYLEEKYPNPPLHHWVKKGLASLEKRLAKDARVGQFCYGDTPSMADVFLVPQVFNAYDAKIDFSVYPTVHRIVTHCMTLPAFINASWEKQLDAEGSNPQI